MGCVYAPLLQELYFAQKGCGAFLNGKAIHVSAHQLDDALLCLQLPYNSKAYTPVIHRLIDRYYGNVGSIRMIGSAAIALCYVAAGRLDVYAEKYLGQWDYMAGALIVREAGGLVTSFEGDAEFMTSGGILATNGLSFTTT